jgi:type III secretory pathway component EscT
LTSAPVSIPESFVRSAVVIIEPEPALVTSASSVTLCVLKSVTSLGLFSICASPLTAFQSAFTLTSAPAAMLDNFVFSASVNAFVSALDS